MRENKLSTSYVRAVRDRNGKSKNAHSLPGIVKSLISYAVLFALFPLGAAAQSATPAFVQVAAAQATSGTHVTAKFGNANTAGNLIVVYVVWDNSGPVSVADSLGNSYFSAVGPTKYSNAKTNAEVFYAKNIAGGTNTVTVTFSTALSSYGIVYAHEYSGIDQTNPVDVTAAGSGTSAAMNSGSATTTNAEDLLFGAGESANTVTAAGSGYASRSTTYGNITEDMDVSSVGSYSATATQDGSNWVMQLVAFRAAGSGSDTTPPSVPTGLTATSVSSTQINLTWNASTDNVGVAGYNVFRNGSQIATVTSGTSYSDTGLSPSTTYTYTVDAYDQAGNTSAQSAPVSATTQAVTATTYTISGSISGTGASGASLALSGTSAATVTSNSSGNYAFTGLQNGNYAVTPSSNGYTFTPSSQSVTIDNNSVTGVDFITAVSNSMTLTWTASTSTNVSGYNVYRGTTSGGPYTLITTSLVAGTMYTDNDNVQAGQTYYYVVTAVNSSEVQSVDSNQASAAIP